LGLAIRVWTITTLGSAFPTTVEVDPGQGRRQQRPVRIDPAPSCTGVLLIVAGFGLALGNWLALAVCLVVPPPAIVRRIQVEEAELNRVLGDPYRAYQTKTKRLIPGVWRRGACPSVRSCEWQPDRSCFGRETGSRVEAAPARLTRNRIFARWGFTIYAARFEPRQVAPPCQSQ